MVEEAVLLPFFLDPFFFCCPLFSRLVCPSAGALWEPPSALMSEVSAEPLSGALSVLSAEPLSGTLSVLSAEPLSGTLSVLSAGPLSGPLSFDRMIA